MLQHWSWIFLWTTFVEHLQPTNPGKIKIYRWTDCPWNTSSKFLEFLFHVFLKKRGSPQKKVSSWSSGIKSSTSVFWRGSGNMEWIPTILVPNNTSSCAPRLFAKPLKRMLIFGTYCFDPKETRGIFDVAQKRCLEGSWDPDSSRGGENVPVQSLEAKFPPCSRPRSEDSLKGQVRSVRNVSAICLSNCPLSNLEMGNSSSFQFLMSNWSLDLREVPPKLLMTVVPCVPAGSAACCCANIRVHKNLISNRSINFSRFWGYSLQVRDHSSNECLESLFVNPY